MKRMQRIYRYECPDCGWVAFRAELVNGLMCSSCGCLDKPLVSTEERAYEIPDEQYQEFEKAKELASRLVAGESMDDITKEIDILSGLQDFPMPIRCISSCAAAYVTEATRKIY